MIASREDAAAGGETAGAVAPGARRGFVAAGLCDAARVRRFCALLLAVQLAGAAFLVAGSYGLVVPLPRAVTTDFVSFYAAGRIAAGPAPEAVYDKQAHFAAERAATAQSIGYVHFFYPPVYLLLCRLFAQAAYVPAFIGFELASLSLLLAALRLVFGAWRAVWLLPVLGFGPLLWNCGFGQNACLTGALFAAGCLMLQRRREGAAGLVLSLLIYKPHFGLLIPLALLAGRHYRAFAAACCGVVLSAGASVALFGLAPWARFAAIAFHAGGEFAQGSVTAFGNMVNLAAALRDAGAGAHAAMLAQAVLSLGVAVAVARVWRGGGPAEGSRHAALISGAVLVMPVVLFYDLVPLVAAGAFLLAGGARERADWQLVALAAAWLLGTFAYPLDRGFHLPAGLICALLVFAVSLCGARGRDSGLVKLSRSAWAGSVRRMPGLAGWDAKIGMRLK